MKKCLTFYCLSMLCLFTCSILLRFFTSKVLIDKLRWDNAFTEMVFYDDPQFLEGKKVQWERETINWTLLYPFKERDEQETVRIDVLTLLRNKVSSIEERINAYTKDFLVNRTFFVEAAYNYEDVLGWRLYDEVVDLGDGYIANKIDVGVDITPLVNLMGEFHDFLSILNINLLYVQSPHKICRHDNLFGSVDFSNRNADLFLSELAERGVSYLDLREALHEKSGNYSAEEHHGWFYRTDHHWKAETGLTVAAVLSEEINRQYGFTIDNGIFEPDNYTERVYENWFLGSLGRKVTLARAEPDNISLFYPDFETDIVFQIPSRHIDFRGSFDVMYDYRQIEDRDYYNRSPYAAYCYGDNPVVRIHNNKVKGGKILIIKDSFVDVLAPFLSLGVEEIELLQRGELVFDGSIHSFVEESRPELVIVMYYPLALNPNDPSLLKLFDFR